MKNKVAALYLGILSFAVAVMSLAALYSHLRAPGRQAVDGTVIGVLAANRFKTRILCRYKVGERTYVCPVMADRDKDSTDAKKGDRLILYFNPDSPSDISMNDKKRQDEILPFLYGLGAALGLAGSVWLLRAARKEQAS